MSAWIVAIKAESKRPECEIGDIVAVYDFEPTPTEKNIFECVEVKDCTAKEVRGNEEFDTETEYPKFKRSIANLSEDDKNIMRTGRKEEQLGAVEKIIKKEPLQLQEK